MNELRRDNLEIENSGTAFGVTNGNVTNDNRTMSGNNIVGGNQINNNLPENWIVPVICATIVIALLIALAAFTIWCTTNNQDSSPEDAEIRIGPRGGVYYVDEFGKREYIDREKGRELYRKRQEDKSDAQQ